MIVSRCLSDFSIAAIALVLATGVGAVPALPAQMGAIDGREIFMNPGKGNCNGCHPVPGTPSRIDTSRVGPDLFAITERIPDRTKLRARIWDMSEANPNTVMPPYGKHRILTEAEIDAVAHYLEKR